MSEPTIIAPMPDKPKRGQKPAYWLVGVDEGQVLILFSDKPDAHHPYRVDRLWLDPRECIEIAEAMTAKAFEAREDLKPVGPALKSELVERHRMKLTQRLAVVMNSKREDKAFSNGQLARELVDLCLKEIFN